jgi:hypothetical protein
MQKGTQGRVCMLMQPRKELYEIINNQKHEDALAGAVGSGFTLGAVGHGSAGGPGDAASSNGGVKTGAPAGGLAAADADAIAGDEQFNHLPVKERLAARMRVAAEKNAKTKAASDANATTLKTKPVTAEDKVAAAIAAATAVNHDGDADDDWETDDEGDSGGDGEAVLLANEAEAEAAAAEEAADEAEIAESLEELGQRRAEEGMVTGGLGGLADLPDGAGKY